MIISLICIVVAFVLGFLSEFGYSVMGAIFFGIMYSFLAFIFSIILILIIGIFPEKIEIMQTRIPLLALQDNSSIQGQFYLFGGTIEGVEYYHYITQVDNYKIKGKVEAEKVRIFEDGENYLIECKKEFKNKVWDYFAIMLDDNCYYEIHIPKNSVTNDFNIDLK